MTAQPPPALTDLLARMQTAEGRMFIREDAWQEGGTVVDRAVVELAALLAANERADDLALIVKAANTFDGVQMDRGAFHLISWTFLRRLYEHDGEKATGAVTYEPIAVVTFEEDDVTPRITDEDRAALAPQERET